MIPSARFVNVILFAVISFVGGVVAGQHVRHLPCCAHKSEPAKCCEVEKKVVKDEKAECPCKRRAVPCKCEVGEKCSCAGFCACAKCPGK